MNIITPYDCAEDIKKHIGKVKDLLQRVRSNLYMRGLAHDASKLQSPEKEAYDIMTPMLGSLEYGSQEYFNALEEFKPIIQHHHQNNSHHPEHYPSGINGMSLLDLIEMLADWKVASSQTKDGNMENSIEVGVKRFGIDEQLASILRATVKEMKWE